jgi:septum site-determining protein MinD
MLTNVRRVGKTMAIVSGKGGSGKTMVAVALAQGIALADRSCILIDADFATGGLTYYLTFRNFKNARIGLSDILEDESLEGDVSRCIIAGTPTRPTEDWLLNISLLPIGDQRRIEDIAADNIRLEMKFVLDLVRNLFDFVIVDCRGGIDKQSISICSLVDEIFIVAETDTTSIKSSQHLVDVIADAGLRAKIVGFALNKVIDDPIPLARTASSLLGVPYLGAIPFDIEATRAYIQGHIPSSQSLFCRHVFSLIDKVFKKIDKYSGLSTLSPGDFGTFTLRSVESRLGGFFLFTLGFYLMVGSAVSYSSLSTISVSEKNAIGLGVSIGFILLLGAALSERIKQSIGRFSRVILIDVSSFTEFVMSKLFKRLR